jgi:hypothetical protein
MFFQNMKAFIKCSCAFVNIVAISYLGPNFLKCTKILSRCHIFLSFLLGSFLRCKNTFMDDYDGIYNYNCLKYGPSKNFDNFDSLIFYGDQNIR